MLMNLKILLPFKLFKDIKNVTRIVADTYEGSFGILPHRLDCVAALVPGIFLYETEEGVVKYLALDEGLLTKAGNNIQVSVRNAYESESLEKLEESVEKDFLSEEKQQKQDRALISKMETGFLRSLDKFHKEE